MIKKKSGKIKIFSVPVFLVFLGLCYITLTAFSPIKRQIISGDRINIVLLGVSDFDYARIAEVIKLVSYEPRTGFLDVVSIPRDTRIPVPSGISWRGFQKLNEVYARLGRSSGSKEEHVEEFNKVLGNLLNDKILIDHYFVVDYRAFTDFVDAIDGVKIEVNNPKYYVDRAQGLYIDISTGIHLMDGETALKYVRYRDRIRGDIGRQTRQHKFLHSVFDKFKSPEIVPKIPSVIRAVMENVETDLKFYDIAALADELRNFKLENFRVQQVPGEPGMRWGISYWEVDSTGLDEIVEVVINSQEINLPLPAADRSRKLSRIITAEVWNASGKSGIARDTTRYLRERNVDVVRYGNYGVRRTHTQVISRRGDRTAEQAAREIAVMLGCRNISTDIDTSRMVDINVVIGEDFNPPWGSGEFSVIR